MYSQIIQIILVCIIHVCHVRSSFRSSWGREGDDAAIIVVWSSGVASPAPGRMVRPCRARDHGVRKNRLWKYLFLLHEAQGTIHMLGPIQHTATCMCIG